MLDINNLKFFESVPQVQKNKGKGVAKLVYCKNGKRLELSKQLVQELGLEEQLQLAYQGDTLWLGNKVPGSKVTYPIKIKKDGSAVLYNSKLAKEIITRLSLDFSTKTACTFYGVELEEYEGKILAQISLGGANNA